MEILSQPNFEAICVSVVTVNAASDKLFVIHNLARYSRNPKTPESAYCLCCLVCRLLFLQR